MASSIYCPRCGKLWNLKSRDEVVNSGSSYSFKKGLAGTVLFGPIGAVAGIGGKNNTTTRHVLYHECPYCGYSQQL